MDKRLSFSVEQDSPDASESLSDTEIHSLLLKKKVALRDLDRRVIKLLKTKHYSSDAKDLHDEIIDMDAALTDLFDLLDDRIGHPAEETGTRKIHRELFKECERLMIRCEKVGRKLNDDIASCQQQETKDAIDPIKALTFAVGFPAAVIMVAKTYWGEKSPVVSHVAEAGIIVGTAIAFHKQITCAWKKARNEVCSGLRHIKNCFLIRYTTQTIKDKFGDTKKALCQNTHIIAQGISKLPSRMCDSIKNFPWPRDPLP